MDTEQSKVGQLTLLDSIEKFKDFFVGDKNAYAILYTPKDCYLLLVNKEGKFFDENGEFVPENIFEARIFNEKAELRWLNESNGQGKMAIVDDSSFPSELGHLDQQYVLWGKTAGAANGKWTKFGSPRIGSFWVPVQLKEGEQYAIFTAKEYLKSFDNVDGNVAVVDERLTGIEGYKGEIEND